MNQPVFPRSQTWSLGFEPKTSLLRVMCYLYLHHDQNHTISSNSNQNPYSFPLSRLQALVKADTSCTVPDTHLSITSSWTLTDFQIVLHIYRTKRFSNCLWLFLCTSGVNFNVNYQASCRCCPDITRLEI